MTSATPQIDFDQLVGQAADVAPFAYQYYSDRPSENNPPETQWLLPKAGLLCGLLWEERRAIRRIEVEFPSSPATLPTVVELSVLVTNSGSPTAVAPAAAPWITTIFAPNDPELARHALHKSFTLQPLGEPVVTPHGTAVFTFLCDKEINSLRVLYSGSAVKVGVPVVRAYLDTTWQTPVSVEIEWGFEPAKRSQRWDGRLEVYNGYAGPLTPLAKDAGVPVLGRHAWQDGPQTAPRRGIRVPVLQTTGDKNSRTVVTLWTSAGDVSFSTRDLASGPILIPSLGLFVAYPQHATTARQFQSQLAAQRLRTVRQQVREEPEVDWLSARKRYLGDQALPELPTPPYEPVMHIDVPDKQLAAQWRLGAWHLTRWSPVVSEDTRCVSIWAFRRLNWIRYGPVAIGLESATVIRALDALGAADIAREGLNYWLFYSKSSTPLGKFVDLGPGPLAAPGCQPDDITRYDQHHAGGHGRVLESCALHHLLTGNTAWLEQALPVLKRACNWIIEQRRIWNMNLPPQMWCHGLQPPSDICDGSDVRLYFSLNAWYYAGLKEAVKVLAQRSPGQETDRLMKEVESYHRDIRTAADRSMALSPVVKVNDGTYRRYVPFALYMRGLGSDLDTGYAATGEGSGHWYEFVMGDLLLVRSGIYDLNEPVVQEMLDVYEDRLVKDGQNGQNGYNDAPALHLQLDDVPLFLRGMYNAYAAEVDPERGYVFYEDQARKHALDKTFEEAAFLERVRAMLIMEDGPSLWLARGTPRAWLEQGKRISVTNASSHFGAVGYEIISDVDHGRINAAIVLPSRATPKTVLLRLRHPKKAQITKVTINGKPWKEFDATNEYVRIVGFQGSVSVVVQY